MAGEDMGASQVNSEVSLPEGRSLKASFHRQTRAISASSGSSNGATEGKTSCALPRRCCSDALRLGALGSRRIPRYASRSLLFTPIFFCISMLIGQKIVNILLSGSDLHCGQKCTVCCNDAAKTDCYDVTGDAYCDTTYQYW